MLRIISTNLIQGGEQSNFIIETGEKVVGGVFTPVYRKDTVSVTPAEFGGSFSHTGGNHIKALTYEPPKNEITVAKRVPLGPPSKIEIH